MNEKNFYNLFLVGPENMEFAQHAFYIAGILFYFYLFIYIYLFIFAKVLTHQIHKTVRGHQTLAQIPRSVRFSEKSYPSRGPFHRRKGAIEYCLYIAFFLLLLFYFLIFFFLNFVIH